MRMRPCAHDSSWFCMISLDDGEWAKPLDHDDDRYLERPMYRWVLDNCWPVVFSCQGWILFGREEDAMLFRLTWEGS